MQDAFTALENCAQPVIAAVHGPCVGGGIDLCCCADIRLCEEKASHTFYLFFISADIRLCEEKVSHTFMAYIVMAYTVMTYIVMVQYSYGPT